jgi:hypothetical protein
VKDPVPNPPLAVHPVVPELKSELVNNCVGVLLLLVLFGVILNPFEKYIPILFIFFYYYNP